MSSPIEALERLAVPAGLDSSRPVAPLLARYRAVRQMTEQIARPLSPEDCQIQSMPDASPAKWHLAHTTWFFETFVLAPHARGFEVFHPSFVYLFNSYYNAVGDRLARPRRGPDHPAHARRGWVPLLQHDHRSCRWQRYLESACEALAADVAAVIELGGINHEQQHQELILTDIKHALAQNPLRPAYREGVAIPSDTVGEPMGWSFVAGGIKWLGHEGHAFAFDNESPRHRVYCSQTVLSSVRRLVTSGEYLAFMQDAGYQRAELWLSDGWNAVNSHQWEAPLYWEKIDGAWWLTTLGGFRRISEEVGACLPRELL